MNFKRHFGPPNIWLWTAWGVFLIIIFLPSIWFFALTIAGFNIGISPEGLASGRATAFGGSRAWGLIARSVALGLGATAVALVLGTFTGYLTTRVRFPGRRILFALLILPFIIPGYCYGIAWIEWFAPGTAVITPEAPRAWIYSLPAAMLLLGVYLFPWVHVVAAVGFSSIERHAEEAARFALPPAARFLRITLPLVAGILASAALFIFVIGLKNQGIPDLLRQNVFAREIIIAYQSYLDERQAALKGLASLIVALVALAFAVRIALRRRRIAVEGLSAPWRCGTDCQSAMDGGVGAFGGRSFAWLAVLAGVVLFAVSFVIPICVLIRMARDWSSFADAWASSKPQTLIGFYTAAGVATACIVLGHCLAQLIHRGNRLVAAATVVCVFVLFALPAPVLDIGLIRFWNRPLLPVDGSAHSLPLLPHIHRAMGALYDSPFMLILGQTAAFLPIAVLGFVVALRRIDPRLLEAAELAGLPRRAVTWRIVLPIMRHWLIGLWAVIFILSLNDIEAAVLLAPPGGDTLSVRIMMHLHYAADSQVAALCLIQLLAAALTIGLVALVVVMIEKLSRM